ncbi:hypothetical protein FXO38_29621 [Capsicum annuum]|nr:hypothetical protein FXO38_29621 [Capsicum annuum]
MARRYLGSPLDHPLYVSQKRNTLPRYDGVRDVVILAIALGLENGVTALVATVRATVRCTLNVGGIRIIGVGSLGVVVVGSSGINGGVSISGGVGIGGVNGVGDGIRVGVGIGIGNMEDLIQFHPTNGPFLAKMDNLLDVIKIELLLDLITSKI